MVNHLLLGFFSSNLVGAASEIFSSVEIFKGPEVWRKIAVKIDPHD